MACKWKWYNGMQATVLTDEEEDKLVSYLISMADMGYGIKQDTVMEMAFMIAKKTHKDHPFKEGKVGHAWFEGFQVCI